MLTNNIQENNGNTTFHYILFICIFDDAIMIKTYKDKSTHASYSDFNQCDQNVNRLDVFVITIYKSIFFLTKNLVSYFFSWTLDEEENLTLIL